MACVESLRSAGADCTVRGCSRVIRQDSNAIEGADVADRDPDKIKQDIDVAREQLASTVDALAERANPARIADDVKTGVVQFVKKPAVAVSLAGCRRRHRGAA